MQPVDDGGQLRLGQVMDPAELLRPLVEEQSHEDVGVGAANAVRDEGGVVAVPRCSRSSVAACQSLATGSPGTSTARSPLGEVGDPYQTGSIGELPDRVQAGIEAYEHDLTGIFGLSQHQRVDTFICAPRSTLGRTHGEAAVHKYPLHRPVEITCPCCGVMQPITFTSPYEHVLGKCCKHHQGDTPDKLKLRDADHVGLWRSELLILQEDHDAEVARLQTAIDKHDQELTEQETEIADLRLAIRQGFENAPPSTVEKRLRDEQLQDAVRKRDSAYRSRDYAYQALWVAARLHHQDEVDDTLCSCGTWLDRCEEYKAISNAIPDLNHWENRERDRLRRGLSHGLPHNHPDVLKFGHGYLTPRR